MKAAILDASYTKDATRFRGMAASWLRWECERLKVSIVSPSDADAVLVTFPSPQEFLQIVTTLRAHGVNPLRGRRRQRVYIGGGVGQSPAILDEIADAVCVGEGRRFLETLVNGGHDAISELSNAWIPGQTRKVYPDNEFPWDLPPVKSEDGIVRVFASRGCKKKCLFCQTGWAQPYVESPRDVGAEQKALTAAGHRVNLVTNDAAALSFYDEIETVEHFSASYSQTLALIDGGINMRGRVKSLRFGVEGVSERLRRLGGKPIETAGLCDLTARLLNDGVGVRWFMIAGLPGETDADWDDLRGAVMRIKAATFSGAVQLSFTAFCPDPAAPLCLAPLTDDYWPRWLAFKSWFFDGPGFSRRVQLMRPAGPKGRLEHAMASMAATEAELRRGWMDRDPPNWRVQYHLEGSARRAFDVYWRRVHQRGLAVI